MSGHTVVVKQDKGDDFPYIAIECSYGEDPERPCRMIDCEHCLEYATATCLDEHEAITASGCGVQEWLSDIGTDGVVIIGLEARVPVTHVHFDEGWHLECEVPLKEAGES